MWDKDLCWVNLDRDKHALDSCVQSRVLFELNSCGNFDMDRYLSRSMFCVLRLRE